jgi:hypothetical protein
VRIKKYASAFLKASPLSILRQLILANFGFRVKEGLERGVRGALVTDRVMPS